MGAFNEYLVNTDLTPLMKIFTEYSECILTSISADLHLVKIGGTEPIQVSLGVITRRLKRKEKGMVL